MTNQIVLRAPSTSTGTIPDPSAFAPPPLSFLQGTWHVTHSTLPMWKQHRNVQITYTPLNPISKSDKNFMTFAARGRSSLNRLDDLVRYQTLKSDKMKTVHGIDTANSIAEEAWNWRGRGILALASSRWEVLGYGHEGTHADGNQWVVTYFAKTIFTPIGVDVYSRSREGLAEKTIQSIKDALDTISDPALKELIGNLFKIERDVQR
jgi:hypothetical protein